MGIEESEAELFEQLQVVKGHVKKCGCILERHTLGAYTLGTGNRHDSSRSVPRVVVGEPQCSVCVPGLCTFAATRIM